MPEREVHVMTVDDHPAFLRAAHELIEATPGFTSVGEFSSPTEALAVIEDFEPDLVLVDVQMPEMNGIELTRRIRARGKGAVVVLISSHDYSEIPAEALNCGAAAVLGKQYLSSEMLKQLWIAHSPTAARAHNH